LRCKQSKFLAECFDNRHIPTFVTHLAELILFMSQFTARMIEA